MSDNVLIKQFKVPVFRKIFRRSHYFVCGVCRTEHHSRADANNCLNHCWYALKQQYPLNCPEETFFMGKSTVVSFVFEEYKTEDAGLECAKLCMDDREKRHVQEQLSSDLPIELAPKRKFRPSKWSLKIPFPQASAPTPP